MRDHVLRGMKAFPAQILGMAEVGEEIEDWMNEPGKEGRPQEPGERKTLEHRDTAEWVTAFLPEEKGRGRRGEGSPVRRPRGPWARISS